MNARFATTAAVLHEDGVVPHLDPTDPVDRIVVAVIADVTDRRGWRHEWDGFDDEVKCDIIAAWREKIGEALTTQAKP